MLNRNQAIEWCVENVNSWPRRHSGIVSFPDGWSWIYLNGQMRLVCIIYLPVSKADWAYPKKVINKAPVKVENCKFNAEHMRLLFSQRRVRQ